MFSVPESSEWNFGISSSFTIFKNKLFKVSTVSGSDVSVFPFSVRDIFSLDNYLPGSYVLIRDRISCFET